MKIKVSDNPVSAMDLKENDIAIITKHAQPCYWGLIVKRLEEGLFCIDNKEFIDITHRMELRIITGIIK